MPMATAIKSANGFAGRVFPGDMSSPYRQALRERSMITADYADLNKEKARRKQVPPGFLLLNYSRRNQKANFN
jgi:hypothetical protein